MHIIVQMLKDMPRCLLLVLRNINIVRSINKELGVPINRFNYMARYGMRGLEVGHEVCCIYIPCTCICRSFVVCVSFLIPHGLLTLSVFCVSFVFAF